MARIYHSAEELIGNTPLLHLKRVEENLGLKAHLFAKLEYLNPAGSVKDRVALAMIRDAEERGLLKVGSVIIEPTSGNTGIGLAAVAAVRGYRVIIVMPDTMSVERRKLLQAYGAELVLTDGTEGMRGAIRKAEELATRIPHSFIPAQFDNPANWEAHFSSTGPEIWADLDGQIHAFVAGVGTGGTLTGVGRYLKIQNSHIEIVAVEPATSAVLAGQKPGSHGLQGIGAGFIPKVLDTRIFDRVMPVTEEEAYSAGRLLCRAEGILTGISSGAALHGAIQLARQETYCGKNIVVLLPDTGDRYLSTPLFST